MDLGKLLCLKNKEKIERRNRRRLLIIIIIITAARQSNIESLTAP
jgi:hypothetical protein